MLKQTIPEIQGLFLPQRHLVEGRLLSPKRSKPKKLASSLRKNRLLSMYISFTFIKGEDIEGTDKTISLFKYMYSINLLCVSFDTVKELYI